jgi:type IV pilus assembly protein PilM
MAFHTIWSVDLGKSALKAVKLRRERNSVEILAVDKVDYPLSDNGVDSTAQAKEALNIFKTRNDVKDPVVVAHPGQGTFSRFIKIPAFDAKKVKDMVRYEASQQIPFPLDEVIWDYHVVNREYLPGEEREVGLFAVRKEAIDDYLLEFTQEGLSVEMLSIGYLGLLNFIKYDINPQEPAIVLDIGAAHTDLILVDGERFWIRPLPHSGNDVSKAIMARFKLAFPDAEKLKLETGKAPQHAEKIFKAVIQPKLQELVQEVHRSIGFYRSQAGEVKFTKCYLLGNGSRVIGIKKFLEEHLGMPVDRVASIGRLRVSRDVNVKLLQTELSAFGTALGLGIQAVGAGSCKVDLVPKEEKVKKEIHRKRKHVFFAAGVLAILIFAAFGLIQAKLAKLRGALEAANQNPIVKETSNNEKTVKGLEQRTNTTLKKRIEDLRQLGELRQGALEGLRSLERILTSISRKDPLSGVVKSDNEEAYKALLAEAETRLKDKVWIPSLHIERITYPEEAQTSRRKTSTGAGGTARGADSPTTVPAYKMSAFVMVKERENQQASADAVKNLFKAPLEQELRAKGWTKKWDIDVKAGTTGLKAIFHQPAGGAAGGAAPAVGAKADEVPDQQGGPFFGAEAIWYMLPREQVKEAAPPKDVPEEPQPPKNPKTKTK